MDTTQAIHMRRSIRAYKPNVQIPQDHIDLMLDAAMHAPSAANKRPWHFIVVESPATRQKIVTAFGHTPFIQTASLAIILCADPHALPNAPDPGFWAQDCAAAAQTLMLQATDLGYGTCWCGLYPGRRGPIIADILEIHEHIPTILIVVGKADETPEMRGFYDKTKVRYIR